MTSRQEAQWVLRAQVGDREAIEALFCSVQPMLARYVRAIVGVADAEDVTQEVMVLIYTMTHKTATGNRAVGTEAVSVVCLPVSVH